MSEGAGKKTPAFPTYGLALSAARLSTDYKLPMADSLILATARVRNATIWTQDSHFEHIPGVRYIGRPA